MSSLIQFQVPSTKCHHIVDQLDTLIDPDVNYYIQDCDIDRILNDFLLSLIVFSSDNVEVNKRSLMNRLDIFEHEAVIFFMAKDCHEKYRDVFSPKLEEQINFMFSELPDVLRDDKPSLDDSHIKSLIIKVMGRLDFNPSDPLIDILGKEKAYQVILNTSISINYYDLFIKTMNYINENNIDVDIYESIVFSCTKDRSKIAKHLVNDTRFVVNGFTQRIFMRLYTWIDDSEVIDILLSKYNVEDDDDTLTNCLELANNYDKFIKLFDKIGDVQKVSRYTISERQKLKIDKRVIEKLMSNRIIHITQ